MSDIISKALLCGLGMASLTKDAIQKTAEDFVSQSKLSEEEGKKLVEEWHRRATHAQATLEKKIDSAVHKALSKLNLARINEKPAKSKKAAKKSKPAGKKATRR